MGYPFEKNTTSTSAGYMFTPAKSAAEYANCTAAISAYINPIILGSQSYDEAFPALLQRMKDAGLDVVLEEIS